MAKCDPNATQDANEMAKCDPNATQDAWEGPSRAYNRHCTIAKVISVWKTNTEHNGKYTVMERALSLRYLWKRREVALKQTAVQAWQDLCFSPPPMNATPQPSINQVRTKVNPPQGYATPLRSALAMAAPKYIGLWGQISGSVVEWADRKNTMNDGLLPLFGPFQRQFYIYWSQSSRSESRNKSHARESWDCANPLLQFQQRKT